MQKMKSRSILANILYSLETEEFWVRLNVVVVRFWNEEARIFNR